MTAAAPGEFTQFWHRHHAALVRWLASSGASPADAQDIAQQAFVQVWRHWPAVASPPGYLYRVARNELTRWRARAPQAAGPAACLAGQPCGDDIPARVQADLVREYLLALPCQQRTVLAGQCDGYQDSELAAAMGVPLATIRSNRRHARASLRSLSAALEQDPRGLAVRRAYAEMRAGTTAPAGARPVISRSWVRSAQHLATPERGPLLAPLSPDELALRRSQSPLRTCHAVWDRQATATGLMIVVTDADGRVLWRAGDRDDLRRGDHDGHGDGACLAEHSVGTSGVSVTLAASYPVAVCGAEHYCPAQHDLVCAGAPVRHPQDGRLLGALCISAPWPAAHRDMLKTIDQTARQVQQQIASHSKHTTPATGPNPAARANRPAQ